MEIFAKNTVVYKAGGYQFQWICYLFISNADQEANFAWSRRLPMLSNLKAINSEKNAKDYYIYLRACIN
jgi:hypothetical protein